MAKTYKGSLTLEWYNKQKAILLQHSADAQPADVPAPRLNWVNKDEALFYEIDEAEGKGKTPFWVDRNDIRVKEARPLVLQKVYKAVPADKPGSLPGMDTTWRIEESAHDDPAVENILIKGDNLLALNTLKKMFDNKPEEEKVKCIYIDPPYNTGSAFEQYDDNLAHSEWLTLMRDRLNILFDILRNDGLIFVQIDNKEYSYLSVLMDEIFNRDNFVQFVSVKRASPAGFKTINPGPVTVTEYILVYAKNKDLLDYKPVYIPVSYDDNYNLVITNIDKSPEEWIIVSIDSIIYKENGIEGWEDPGKAWRNAEKKWGKAWQVIRDQLRDEFSLNNSEKVVSVRDPHKPSDLIKETMQKSKKNPGKVYRIKREEFNDIYIYNGGSLSFYKNKLRTIDNIITPTELLTDFWTDINYAGIANEGEIQFKNSKKPEKLVKRVLEMSTNENDIILDCFGGSGTTFAVSHKMKRKWIGIEIGNHIDTHIITRLITVLNGADQSGISKSVSWRGGGSFKYYHLGESIIKTGADGQGDFNWSLGRRQIEENFLFSYDYQLAGDFQSPQVGEVPAVGVQRVGNDLRMAIVSLCAPDERGREMLGEDELLALYEAARKQYNPRYINVFTNRGVELAYDAKPDDLEVIKVPHAIFSELEK